MRADRAGDEPVPGYKLVRMLGQGRFGWVWRAAGRVSAEGLLARQ
jgi:hypothetical protein